MSEVLARICDTIEVLKGVGFELMSDTSSVVEMRRKSDRVGLQILHLDDGQWRASRIENGSTVHVEVLPEIGEVEKWARSFA